MSAAFLAFTGIPGTDDFISSQIKHALATSAAIEFFKAHADKNVCTVARIPASTKNINKKHHIWDDIKEGAADTEELERAHVIDAVKSGRYHSQHEQHRLKALEKSYDDVMRFKGRAVYYSLLILFLLILSLFLPTGYFEIYLYPIVAGYALIIALSYYIVHLGCKGWAREFNPPAEDIDTLVKDLTV